MLFFWSILFLFLAFLSLALAGTMSAGAVAPLLLAVVFFLFFLATTVAMITGRWGPRQPRIEDENTINSPDC